MSKKLETPRGLRLHIGIFGRRNAGKSTLLNALAGQQVAIVSAIAGTTTDPVEKVMELAPLGPVVIIDTAGLDDGGELGQLRIKSSRAIVGRCDLALLVSEYQGPGWQPDSLETEIATFLADAGVPFAVVLNKIDVGQGAGLDHPQTWQADLGEKGEVRVPLLPVSALTGAGLPDLRKVLADLAARLAEREGDTDQPPLLGDLLPPAGMAILVVPVDSGAPKGRLILPQVMAIRDCLDHQASCLVVRDSGLAQALAGLRQPPDLVVCDSQVVDHVDQVVPATVPMTTFSVLMARQKSDLDSLAAGTAALARLKPGDPVLIGEACSHHPQKDDIGRIKLPRLLNKLAGGELRFTWLTGRDFADFAASAGSDGEAYAAIVHCGACMLTRGQMQARLRTAQAAGKPMSNYGMAISLARGVLERVLSPFPSALAAWHKAIKA